MYRIPLLVAAATLATAFALALPSRSGAATCGDSGYSYAGITSLSTSSGVSAAVTSLTAPTVSSGHVAAWVGVGGAGLGPNGTNEWLQVGISALPGQSSSLYYELALPNVAPKYVTLSSGLKIGRSYKIAVLESATRPGWWRVWVNGSPVTKAIHLLDSHNAWRPVATTESWDGGVPACNAFKYRFTDVNVTATSGAWVPMHAQVLKAPGYVVSDRTAAGFDAFGGV
jgi:hypothetical protein